METPRDRIPPSARAGELPRVPLPGSLAALVLLGLFASIGAQGWILAIPCALVCGALYSAIRLLRRTVLADVGGLVCLALVFFLHPDPCGALIFLSALPAAVMQLSLYRGRSRLYAIAAASVSEAALLAAVFFAFCLFTDKSAAVLVRSAAETAAAQLAAWTVVTADGVTARVFSEETALLLVRYTLCLSPSICAVLLFLANWFRSLLLRLTVRSLGAGEDFLPDGWELRAGPGCAAVFCTALLTLFLAATTQGAQGVYYAACNVTWTFGCPMALYGASVLVCRIRSLSSVGAFTKVAAVFLLFMIALAGITWLIAASALYGAYTAFRSAWHREPHND